LPSQLKRHRLAATMTTLTIKLSAEDAKILECRARRAKMTKVRFIRQLIREQSLQTGGDIYEWALAHMGDRRFRVSRK
jgi:hypothetical protein